MGMMTTCVCVAGGVALGLSALPMLGFGLAGIVGGSIAAGVQGPAVAAGSWFATLQSVGATGKGAGLLAALGGTAGGLLAL